MIIAFDTETALSLPGLAAPPLACGSFAWFGADGSIKSELLDAAATANKVTALLRDPSVVIVGHNIAYDFCVVAAWVFKHRGVAAGEEFLDLVFKAHHDDRIRDTDYRERLIAIAKGEFAEDRDYAYSLATLAKQRLGIELDKDGTHRHSYGRLAGAPISAFSEKQRTYALEDARATLLVWDDQARECDDYILPSPVSGVHGVWHEPHVCRKAFAMYLMRVWGVRTDPEYVVDLERRMLQEEQDLMRDLVSSGILVKHPKKNEYTEKKKPVQDRVVAAFAAKGRKAPTTDPTSKFPSGQVKTDAETCEDSGDPVLLKKARYTYVNKILNTYVPPLKQGVTVPINAQWNPQLKSDRTSCKDPAWQTPPQEYGVRQCVIPGPGMLFVSADYDTIELKGLANFNYEMFGFSLMRERICQGVDIHTSLGTQLTGLPSYEWAMANKNSKEVRFARKVAKPYNFGVPGGLGAATFCDTAKREHGLIFTHDEFRRNKEIYLAENPEMVRFFAMVKAMTPGGSGTVTTPCSGFITGDRSYPAACNQHFQGPVAFGATDGLFYVSWECYVRRPSHRGGAESDLYGSRPTLFLHDENVLAVPESRPAEAAKRLSTVMVERMQRIFPHVPITVSPALMRRWYKEADSQYGEGGDRDGQLIPWEDAAFRELMRGLAA